MFLIIRFNSLISNQNQQLFAKNNDVFFDTTNAIKNVSSKIDKLDMLQYRNKLNQIISSLSDKKHNDEFLTFLRKFIVNRSEINQSTLETIFPPNKASQTILSSTGSEIDITALILNLINPVPDPLIYLEEKGGLIRNYGISVIIDSSLSCHFGFSSCHSLLTIRTILSSLAALDLPCFDLIVAGDPDPIVLCSEVGTLHTLNQKSTIWESLFSILEKPVKKADLASAIHTAFDLRRMRSKDYTSFVFVLTDGLYEKCEMNRILQIVNNCVQSGSTVFGIGIGVYPKGIEQLFPQVVFATNPSLVMKSIAALYGDSISGRMDKILPLCDEIRLDIIKNAFNILIKNEDKPIYKNLKNELTKVRILQDAYRHYLNKEGDIGDASKGFTNFDGTMYQKDTFKSQKILIVMLWDFSMNPAKEKKELQVQYINENINKDKKECIKTAVEYFGISLDIVQNYKDAIEKLLKQTKPGFCDYYAVWIMCGPPLPNLPDKSAYPNLVGQFIDVLIQFWENGGSLVFWAEGDPLYYQVNLFLEKRKYGFKIEGNHQGEQILLPDDNGDLKNKQTFNRDPQGDDRTERSTLAYNLGRIFEGVTISYAPYNLAKIQPFIPFSRDSEGGISSLFLPSDSQKGDIVIDCGYTKCFANLDKDGTYRYIQNIAGWTMRMEYHITDGFSPRDWRPKAVIFKMNLNAEWTYPVMVGRTKVDIIFLIDATGSMGSWIQGAREKAELIANSSHSEYPSISFRFGAIFYRDPIDCKEDSHSVFQPTDNISNLVNFMSSQKASGGRDTPEDWAGAYHILFNKISWRNDTSRGIIHIADAPAHSKLWCGSENHEEEAGKLEPLIQRCAKEKIFFSGINVNGGADISFTRIGQIYAEEKRQKLFKVSSIKNVDSDSAGNFLQNIAADLIATIAAF